MKKIFVVIPNWNGMDSLGACLDSLLIQTQPTTIVVVENGSTDGSLEFVREKYPQVELVVNQTNLGFAGGVNSGITYAMKHGANAVALLNNDAVAHVDWLKHLVKAMETHPDVGITTSKLLSADKETIDSTGDIYTTWGLPFPRGRDEPNSDKYDEDTYVFGGSGGASLYRTEMLEQIGLFDKDFFAYYEDIDISFRAQLAGWKVLYVPTSEAYHQHGTTSSKIKGFTTYQTFKNYPWLFWKNVPLRLVPGIFVRFTIAYVSIYLASLREGRGWPATKGFLAMLWLFPKKIWQRNNIQRNRKVSVNYVSSVLVHDLPPNSARLRKLRSFFVRN